MGDVAIIREDTRNTLVLEGATALDYDRPGRVTQYPVPDRSHISDGIVLMPRTVDIEAIVSPGPGRADLTTGDARLREVETFLEEVQAEGTPVAVQRPSEALITSLVVESFRTVERGTEGFQLTVRLQTIQVAQARTVQIAALQGPPKAVAKAVTEDTKQTGTGSTKPRQSLLNAGLNSLVDLVTQ